VAAVLGLRPLPASLTGDPDGDLTRGAAE
jgi:hypothetical protein